MMWKRTGSLILAVVMLLALAACGNPLSTDKTPDDSDALPASIQQVEKLVKEKKYDAAYQMLQRLDGAEADEWKDKLVPVLVSERTNGRGDWSSKVTYTYDILGRLMVEETTEPQGAWSKVAYTYASSGNCLTKTETTHYGGLLKTTYTYDEQGVCLTKTEDFDYGPQDDRWYCTTTYEYDQQGLLLAAREQGDEDHTCTTTYTYNAQGLLVSEETSATAENGPGKTDYEYDENGQCIRKEATGEFVGGAASWAYTYDEQGRLSEMTEIWGSTNSRYVYVYDANGNKSHEMLYNDERIDDVTEYTWEIRYFPKGYIGK